MDIFLIMSLHGQITMANQDKYNLTWQSFHSHVQTFLKDLFSSTNFTDVTLVSEDKQKVRAHKNVLSACSPVLKELLLLDEKNNQPIIFLKGVKYQELDAILQFIYLGQATFQEERVSQFLDAATSLEIKDLSQIHTTQTVHQNASNPESKYEIKYQTMDLFGAQATQILPKQDAKSFMSYPESYETLQCDYCELKYQTKSGLTSHIKTVHNILLSSNPSGQIHNCSQCEFQTANSTSLRRHVMAKHEYVKHSCDQCSKVFSYSHDLKRHILSVHEGKRYPCDMCSHETTQIGDLAKHKRIKHSKSDLTNVIM